MATVLMHVTAVTVLLWCAVSGIRQHRRALAHAVHGQVQAAVAAGILDIASAVRTGMVTDDHVRDVHQRIVVCVEQLDLRQAVPIPLDLLITKVQATWAGLASLSMEVDPGLAALLTEDPQCLMTLNDLVPELTFNSVKHGRATDIRISITRADERFVRLIVVDDGQSRGEAATPGMGSRILDEATMEWTRLHEGSYTVTTAWLPFAPSRPRE